MNAESGSADTRAESSRWRETWISIFAVSRGPKCRGTPRSFERWLDRGDAGEMNYLARNSERRCDPREILPDAKTVIVLALNYFQGAHKIHPVEAGVSPAGVATKKIAAGTGVTTATGRIRVMPGAMTIIN